MSNKAKIREDAMKLNPIDDALFCKMAEVIPFCEEILQVILSDKALKVLSAVPQFVAKNMQGRSCILDLKCRLGDGRLADVEVQRADDDDHQRRVLYNSALLITNTANPGTNFKEVPEVIVIFISKFDIFGRGRALYHVDRVIREEGLTVYNGMEEIYVNTAVNDKTDVAELMKVFVEDDTYNDEKFPATSSSKRRFKTTEEGVKEMCEIIERNRAEAKAETVIEMLKDNLPLEKITQYTKLTNEEIRNIGKTNGFSLA